MPVLSSKVLIICFKNPEDKADSDFSSGAITAAKE